MQFVVHLFYRPRNNVQKNNWKENIDGNESCREVEHAVSFSFLRNKLVNSTGRTHITSEVPYLNVWYKMVE